MDRSGGTVFRGLSQLLVVAVCASFPGVLPVKTAPQEEAGFEPVWGFFCQVVIFGL
jgi:hypothetical protein